MALDPTTSAVRTRNPHWHGMLCADTRDDIAARMREVLGDGYFTLVCCNSFDETSQAFASVDVYPSQWLSSPLTEHLSDGGYNHLSWSTPRLAMGVHTKATTQSDGRNGSPHDYVHFHFEPGRVEIDHFAPARYRLRWIFAVERHDRDDREGA